MKRRKIFHWTAAVSVAALLGAGGVRMLRPVRENNLDAGQALLNKAAPKFTLPDLFSSTQTHTEQIFSNKVSLLNIWASWCASCRQEHPLLMKMKSQRTALLYGVNFLDAQEDGLEYLTSHGDPYDINLSDEHGAIGDPYHITALPLSYLIDKKGIIRYRHIGVLTESYFDAVVSPAIHQLQQEAV